MDKNFVFENFSKSHESKHTVTNKRNIGASSISNFERRKLEKNGSFCMQSGITLVALVVTIVVLLILAGVSISLVLGNNGIITKTQATKYKQQVATMKEELELYIGDKTIETSGSYDSTKLSATINSLVYNGVAQTGETIKNILTTESNDVLANYSVAKGELKYLGNDSTEASLFSQVIYNDSSIKIASAQSSIGTVTVSDTKEGTLDDYKIYGTSVQNGVPTQDIPVNVVSLGENSKNLFNISLITNTAQITNNKDGTLTIAGGNYACGTGKKLSELCPELKVGDTAVINANTTATRAQYIYLYGENNTWKYGDTKQITQVMLDSSIYVYGQTEYAEDFNQSHTISNIQIELGTTATEYRPYKYIDVISSGKNLFYNKLSESSQGITLGGVKLTYNSDGSITLNGTATGGASTVFDSYRTISTNQKNKAITVSLKSNKNVKCYFYCGYFNQSNVPTNNISNGTVINTNTKNTSSTGFPDSAATTRAWIGVVSGVVYDNVTIYPQIEIGTEETTYEQYKKPVTTTIDLTGHEPLRKIGDISDYIDYNNQQIVRNIRNISLKISDMNNSESYPGWTTVDYILKDFPQKNNTLSGSTKFVSNISNSLYSVGINTLGNKIVFLRKEYFSKTQTEWKTNYTNLIFKLYYQLSSPETESISLPKLSTYGGTTNIYVTDSNGMSASNLSISYMQK